MERSFDDSCAAHHGGLPVMPGTNAVMATHTPPGNGLLPHNAVPSNGLLASVLSHAPGNGNLPEVNLDGNGIMATCTAPGNGILSITSTMAGDPMPSADNNGMGTVNVSAPMMMRAGPGSMPGPSSGMTTPTSQPFELAGLSVHQPSPEGSHSSGTSATTSPTGETDNMGQPVTKDEAYWEKRRKNNESAKRSREARRQKEAAVAYRALQLERENYVLETQLRYLQADVDQLERQALSIAKPNQNKAVMYANNLNTATDFDSCQYDMSSHTGYHGPPPPPPPAGSTA